MDLPTYTNIWRIEKRLYKLYDFRLPMPLPINWIAVFAGITIPYIVLLIAIGLPFNHTLVWLYVLPPAVLTWLTTRPVIENKRLPELVESQARYLAEPKTWVRLTPLSEKDRMVLTARVWRNGVAAGSRPASARPAAALPAARQARPERTGQVLRPTSIFRPEPAQAQASALARQAARGQASRQRPAADADIRPRAQERVRAQERARSSTRGHGQVRLAPALPTSRQAQANRPAPPGIPPEPQSPGLAAHAMPDVLPAGAPRPAAGAQPPAAARPAAARPAAAAGPGIAPRQESPSQPAGTSWPLRTAQIQESRPGTPGPAPAAPAGQEPGTFPQTFAAPTPRVRASGSAAVAPELSHDGPGRRRPAEEPAAHNPQGTRWPARPATVAAPAGPVRPAPPEMPSRGPGEPPARREEHEVPSRPAGPSPLVQSAPHVQSAPQVQPAQPVQSARTERPVPPPSPVSPTPLASQATTTPRWPVPARPLRPVANPADAAAGVASPAPPLAEVPQAEVLQAEVPQAEAPQGEVAHAEVLQAEVAHAEVPQAEAAQGPRPEAPAREPESPPAPEPAEMAQAHAQAPAAAAPAGPAVRVPSIERALSAPSRDLNASWHGKVKVVTGNGATPGPGARDQEALDRNRARLPIGEPKRILVLGCTSGAGQSVTALMTGSMLASLREHPVAAVDLHDGTLARYRAPAAWLEELLAGRPPQHIVPTRPDGLHPTPKLSPARLDVVASHEPLSDGDEIKLLVQTNRHYPLTVLDPGAAGLSRLLRVTDQLVVVVPANVDAASALADTRDWLDNNGHADLAMQSVTVINGVSRRSLPDVEDAESVARGRSRAIVRVPWDDMLPVAATGPATLRPQTRVAYTALAGVLVAGLSAAPSRKKP